MSTKYLIEPTHRDKTVLVWILLVIIIALSIIGIAYAQQEYVFGGDLIKKEVIGNINLHITVMIIVVALVVIAWGLGRKKEEITVAPGETLS